MSNSSYLEFVVSCFSLVRLSIYIVPTSFRAPFALTTTPRCYATGNAITAINLTIVTPPQRMHTASVAQYPHRGKAKSPSSPNPKSHSFLGLTISMVFPNTYSLGKMSVRIPRHYRPLVFLPIENRPQPIRMWTVYLITGIPNLCLRLANVGSLYPKMDRPVLSIAPSPRVATSPLLVELDVTSYIQLPGQGEFLPFRTFIDVLMNFSPFRSRGLSNPLPPPSIRDFDVTRKNSLSALLHPTNFPLHPVTRPDSIPANMMELGTWKGTFQQVLSS